MCETKDNEYGECIFPFREKREDPLHHKCAPGTIGTFYREWCAFEVDVNNVMKSGKWAICGDAKRCRGKNKMLYYPIALGVKITLVCIYSTKLYIVLIV